MHALGTSCIIRYVGIKLRLTLTLKFTVLYTLPLQYEMVCGIGGDLVQDLGGRGRRISAENFFCILPKIRNLGTAGDSLSFGNVGSVLMCIDPVYSSDAVSTA